MTEDRIISVSILMPAELRATVQRAADQADRSLSAEIRRALAREYSVEQRGDASTDHER